MTYIFDHASTRTNVLEDNNLALLVHATRRSPNITSRPQTTMTIMVRSYSSSSFESDDASRCSTSEESSCWDELQRGGSGEDVEALEQENGRSGSTPEQVQEQDLQMEDLDEEHVN